MKISPSRKYFVHAWANGIHVVPEPDSKPHIISGCECGVQKDIVDADSEIAVYTHLPWSENEEIKRLEERVRDLENQIYEAEWGENI